MKDVHQDGTLLDAGLLPRRAEGALHAALGHWPRGQGCAVAATSERGEQ